MIAVPPKNRHIDFRLLFTIAGTWTLGRGLWNVDTGVRKDSKTQLALAITPCESITA